MSGHICGKNNFVRGLKLRYCELHGDEIKGYDYETDEKIIRGLHEAGFKYIDFSMYYFAKDSVYMQDGWEIEVLKLKAVADELDMEFVQAHSLGTNPFSENVEDAEFVVDATIRSIEICEMLGIEDIEL